MQYVFEMAQGSKPANRKVNVCLLLASENFCFLELLETICDESRFPVLFDPCSCLSWCVCFHGGLRGSEGKLEMEGAGYGVLEIANQAQGNYTVCRRRCRCVAHIVSRELEI